MRSYSRGVFGRQWERVEGEVLAEAVHRSHHTDDGTPYLRMKYVVGYQLAGAAPVRVELKEPERFGTKVIRSLTRGEVVPLLVDARSGKVRFDVDDPAINRKAARERARRRGDDDFRSALDD